MNDFFQAGGKNVRLIDNLHREYMALQAEGKSAVSVVNDGLDQSSLSLANEIYKRTNVDIVIVIEFLKSIYNLSKTGKIPYEKWNPKGYKKSETAKKTFSTEKGFFDFAKSTAGYGKIVLIVAGIGASAYLLNQFNQFKGVKKNES